MFPFAGKALVLASGVHDDTRSPVKAVPIALGIEDRLDVLATPVRRVSSAMVGILVGSLAFHALIVVTALITTRTLVASPPHEIPIDVVEDVPKPTPPPKPTQIQHAKLEDAPAHKPAPAAPVPQAPQTAQPRPAAPKASANEVEDLQKELAALRAQQAALKTASTLEKEAQTGGPMANATRAVALPSASETGEVVGYQDLVFSQLAKAKGIEGYHGEAGTTGVRFELDTAGQLMSADVAVTSGNPKLDKQALEIVHRAAPFPPPPRGADHRFFANVNFVPPTP